jgi:hypothetical protein
MFKYFLLGKPSFHLGLSSKYRSFVQTFFGEPHAVRGGTGPNLNGFAAVGFTLCSVCAPLSETEMAVEARLTLASGPASCSLLQCLTWCIGIAITHSPYFNLILSIRSYTRVVPGVVPRTCPPAPWHFLVHVEAPVWGVSPLSSGPHHQRPSC